ncbi:MAG TPA: ATP-binding protein [Gaiellaceae bacterium]|nr:ATP-binding protein [Gaiellaceae bacterium]
MSRLPIRVRLTLAFALAMAAVLAATGAFLYLRLQSSLDEAVHETLAARLVDATALARSGATGRTVSDESLTEIRTATAPPARTELERVPGMDGRVRLAYSVVDTPRGKRLVIVGAALGDRDEALTGLLRQLLIAVPVALIIASLLGYWLAGAALRPVEAMRAEAAAISGSEPGRRLPRGEADDEISRLATTLNEMLARLERAIERERSFVADASHELRTPLALLRAELELALRKPRTAPELEAAIRSATAETDRLVRLAEDLLVLAQADEGRLPLRREPVRAADVLGAVREAFRSRADAAGRSIETDVADAIVLAADRLRLQQALGNLVDNALRYGEGAIRLDASARDGLVEFHVRDEGPGLPPEFLPHAFERFTRAEAARTGGGTGLGLALAAAIAEAHGGTAEASSEHGGDVWLSLPQAVS